MEVIDPEGREKYIDQLEAEQEDERTAEELRERRDDGHFLQNAKDIDLSKLSNNIYKDNAEQILSHYVLSYQGKDGSGNNMKDSIIDFYDCASDASFQVEILRWNDEMIIVELSSDYGDCDNYVDFLFGYKPHTNDLRYIIDQTWKEQAKSVMNYLDINP